MATPEEAIEQLDSVAAGDKKIESDGKALTAHDLGELIEYAKFTQNQTAGSTGLAGFGIRITQLVPPGCG